MACSRRRTLTPGPYYDHDALFEKGRLYRRDEIHNEWGGATQLQAQGGILTPREVPLIIVVTGEEGTQYGYDDFWDADGVFHYFGAGRSATWCFGRATWFSAITQPMARTFTYSSRSPRHSDISGRWSERATTSSTTCPIRRDLRVRDDRCRHGDAEGTGRHGRWGQRAFD